MHNTLTSTDIKRRGMAAIEEGLRRGPVHLIKHKQLTAVVLSEADYQRLIGGQAQPSPEMTALQWLLAQPTLGARSKAEIDAALAEERTW